MDVSDEQEGEREDMEVLRARDHSSNVVGKELSTNTIKQSFSVFRYLTRSACFLIKFGLNSTVQKYVNLSLSDFLVLIE